MIIRNLLLAFLILSDGALAADGPTSDCKSCPDCIICDDFDAASSVPSHAIAGAEAIRTSTWCLSKIGEGQATFWREIPGQPNGFLRIRVDPLSFGGNATTSREKQACRDNTWWKPHVARSSLIAERAESLGPNLVDVRRSRPGEPASTLPPRLDLFAFRESDDQATSGAPQPGRRGVFCTDRVTMRGRAIAGLDPDQWEEDSDEPDPTKRKDAAICMQREELTTQFGFPHAYGETLAYSLRFRLPGHIEDEVHSVRWVIAQWKQRDISSGGGSPFLAARFDDGLLHFTVQEADCRCVVAWEGDSRVLANGASEPQRCESTERGKSGMACPAKRTIRLAFGKGELPSPRGNWIDLDIRIRLEAVRPSTIEIRHANQSVVTINGDIGYPALKGAESDAEPDVYFKFGGYRDYLPWLHYLDMDRLRVMRIRE